MDETKRQPYGDEGWFAFITFLHCQYLVFNIGWIIFYAAFGLLSPPSLLSIAIYAVYEITLIVMYFKRFLGMRLVYVIGNIILLVFQLQSPIIILFIIKTALITIYLYLSKRIANTYHDRFGVYHYLNHTV